MIFLLFAIAGSSAGMAALALSGNSRRGRMPRRLSRHGLRWAGIALCAGIFLAACGFYGFDVAMGIVASLCGLAIGGILFIFHDGVWPHRAGRFLAVTALATSISGALLLAI